MSLKVVHLTSAHPRYDIRIYGKICSSIASRYDTALVVADDKGDEVTDVGVQIYDVGVSLGRLNRMIKTTKKVYKKALELNASVYHLHDPELIPIGLKLKKNGFKVKFIGG